MEVLIFSLASFHCFTYRMYKFSTNDLPSAFKEYFHKRSSIHNYQTRHVNGLNLTNNKKSFSDHSIRTCGPIFWNSLPTASKDSKSVNHFRNQFKHKDIQTYVKSILNFPFLSPSLSCLVFYSHCHVCFSFFNGNFSL